MKQTPQSYTLLHVQCDFLRAKGNNEWAIKLAKQAVNCAPSEFVTWEKLTDIYIDLAEYESVGFFRVIGFIELHYSFYAGTPNAQFMSYVHL